MEALRLGLKGMSKEEVPKLGEALLQGWPVMVTVLVLIALLARGYGLPFCAFYTVATLIVLSFLGFAALAVVLSNRFLCLTTIFERITFLAGGILLAMPEPLTDLLGGLALAAAVFSQHKKWMVQNAT